MKYKSKLLLCKLEANNEYFGPEITFKYWFLEFCIEDFSKFVYIVKKKHFLIFWLRDVVCPSVCDIHQISTLRESLRESLKESLKESSIQEQERAQERAQEKAQAQNKAK